MQIVLLNCVFSTGIANCISSGDVFSDMVTFTLCPLLAIHMKYGSIF